ncbi:Polyketide cyclase / dehydrase and lipid transport [Roseivivax lentus]|uniref:Polyketide cyclase / dehydrase and lipid transport n=1 Tax=Roseivivax lentus TaxID=633194 RepID=A0A1N7Q0Y4_9RHOB|nr:SRPBCC family protein [Roseivivax lentus]SIT16471.1 Polyketide cyclase / dehydrase and lipid transport [Roseivivax lentus]
MPTAVVKTVIEAPVSKVWATWDNFGHIDKFNPNLKRSFLIDKSASTGLGAQRQCDLADGKNHVKERIVEYVPERLMVVDIYDGTIPLKSATARIALVPLATGRTELTFSLSFVPKLGVLGRIIGPLMKWQIRKQIAQLVAANRRFIEARAIREAA